MSPFVYIVTYRNQMEVAPLQNLFFVQSVLGRNKCKCNDLLMPSRGHVRSCAIQNFMPRMVGWNVCLEK